MCRALLLLAEFKGYFTRWVEIGSSWSFIPFHGVIAVFAFWLRQFGIARILGCRPYNALAFSGLLIMYYSSLFLIYPLGQSSWFFAPSFGVASIFRFLLFYRGFIIGL